MKTNKTINFFSVGKEVVLMTTLLLMTGATSFAQQMEKVNNSEVQALEKWDTDTDQQLNNEEFDSFISDIGLHGDWDKNYDGVFDDDELYTGFLYDWDKNGDDFISKDEYASGNTEWEREYGDSFEEWDINSDNRLELEEYAEAMNQTGVFAGWDADNDGKYNEDEVNKGLFEYYDSDDDGFVSDKEYDEVNYESDYQKGYEEEKLIPAEE